MTRDEAEKRIEEVIAGALWPYVGIPLAMSMRVVRALENAGYRVVCDQAGYAASTEELARHTREAAKATVHQCSESMFAAPRDGCMCQGCRKARREWLAMRGAHTPGETPGVQNRAEPHPPKGEIGGTQGGATGGVGREVVVINLDVAEGEVWEVRWPRGADEPRVFGMAIPSSAPAENQSGEIIPTAGVSRGTAGRWPTGG